MGLTIIFFDGECECVRCHTRFLCSPRQFDDFFSFKLVIVYDPILWDREKQELVCLWSLASPESKYNSAFIID